MWKNENAYTVVWSNSTNLGEQTHERTKIFTSKIRLFKNQIYQSSYLEFLKIRDCRDLRDQMYD